MASAEQRIVVGVDGSQGARGALVWALAEAARRGAAVEVVNAVPVDVYWLDPFLLDAGRIEAVRADTEALVQRTVDEVVADPAVSGLPGSARLDVRVSVAAGPPAQRLVRRSEGAALLVVGSRGLGAVRSALRGSVSAHCAAHARCPVVVVPVAGPPPEEQPRVVVGLDDSAHARAALSAARAAAVRLGARLDVVIGYEGPQYWSDLYVDMLVSPEEARRRSVEGGRQVVDEVIGRDPAAHESVDVRAVEGPPGQVLVREAAGARLLVVGSRSRNPLEGLLLGSVALHCVISAPCPVLVVRGHPEEPAPAAVRLDAATASPVG